VNLHATLVLIGAVCAAILTAAAIIYRPRSVPQWSFLAAFALLALEHVFQFFSLQSISESDMLFWQRLTVWPISCLPLAWLLFSLTYARGNARQFLRQWLPALVIFGGLPLVASLTFWRDTVTEVVWTSAAGNWSFPVSLAGKVLHIALLVSAMLVLTHQEWTFRSAVGTARWKIKYTVIGLAVLCGARIYSSSQVILYSVGTANLIAVNAAAVILGSVLFAIALYRAKFAHVDIYPSPAALHRSFTVLLAGAYLIIIGLVARAVSTVGGGESFPLTALVLLAGLSGLGVLCLSDRVRNATKQFISRHFNRPSHDYRNVWSKFTQRTVAVLDRQEFARQMVGVISETFEALSVTIWIAEVTNGRFVFGASTALEARAAVAMPIDNAIYRELILHGTSATAPLDLDRSAEHWCVLLKEINPTWFPKVGGHRLCVPLVFGDELGGLLVLGDRVGGVPFTEEDLELLKCLGDQMAAGLRTLGFSEKLVRAKELEAFQVMSAFLVHDLKNTASALSLMLGNLQVHFENPAFWEDALRTLSHSVQRVNELISRLSTLRQKLELHRTHADLNQLIAAALQSVGESALVTVVQNCQPLPPFSMDAPQIESAIVNLLLNAREAIAGRGEIRIETFCQNGEALLAISDNGCGMSAEFLAQSLFKPFKTSKKSGLGIGMYQTKTVIEAHGGRIAVQSEAGKGTTFRVSLPLIEAA
jgi:putative PEP-CTERM system histidine kinase